MKSKYGYLIDEQRQCMIHKRADNDTERVANEMTVFSKEVDNFEMQVRKQLD